jgi:hypothetical protein
MLKLYSDNLGATNFSLKVGLGVYDFKILGKEEASFFYF